MVPRATARLASQSVPAAARRRDAGYAMVAAVVAVAAFAYLALQVLATDQGGVAMLAARMRQARLSAAADAGVSLAIHGLGSGDRATRWSIDGRSRQADFDGVALTIVVQDERGKAPLAQLDEAQLRALFSGAGATGERLGALVAELRDWQTDPAAGGQIDKTHLPPSDGRPVRHGPMPTVGELGALPDMTPRLFARVAPAVTTFFEDNGPFEASHATALAKAAMDGDQRSTPEQLDSQAIIDNQRPEEEIAADDHLFGRTLTVNVVARDFYGAQTHRSAIIEFTGDRARPYWIRYVE